MSNTRSSRPEVRNPVLALPAAQRLRELDGPSRAALRAVLEELRRDAHARAEKSWPADGDCRKAERAYGMGE